MEKKPISDNMERNSFIQRIVKNLIPILILKPDIETPVMKCNVCYPDLYTKKEIADIAIKKQYCRRCDLFCKKSDFFEF